MATNALTRRSLLRLGGSPRAQTGEVELSGKLAYFDGAGNLVTWRLPEGQPMTRGAGSATSLLAWLDDGTLLVHTAVEGGAVALYNPLRNSTVPLFDVPSGFRAVSSATGPDRSFAVVLANQASHAPSRLFRTVRGAAAEVPIGTLFVLGASFIGPSLVLVAQRRDAFEQLAQWSESGGTFTRTVAAGDVSGRYLDIAVNRHGVQALVRFEDDPLRISTEIRGPRGDLLTTIPGWGSPAWSNAGTMLALSDRIAHVQCGSRVAIFDLRGIRAIWAMEPGADTRPIGWSGEAVIVGRGACDLREVATLPIGAVSGDVLALHAPSGKIRTVVSAVRNALWRPTGDAD